MTSLKLNRIAAALVCAGMTLALNTQAADRDAATRGIGAEHGRSAQAQQQMQDVRASKLIGTVVEGSDGKRLGEIEDLVIDLETQRVHYAVLGHGGVMGVGEKLFAYPVSALQPAAEGRLRLDVTEQKLKDAPGFDRRNWPDWNDRQVRSRVDQYYGETRPVKPDENPRYVRASEFIGKDIDDRADRDIGEVEDLIVNMKDGTLHYVLVEFDDWHPDDDKLYVLAPSAFKGEFAKNKDLRLDLDRQQLAGAPSIAKDRLNEINDRQWTADVKRHLDSGSMRGATGSTPGRGAVTEGSPGGRVQSERAPTGGDRASGTTPTAPQPAR